MTNFIPPASSPPNSWISTFLQKKKINFFLILPRSGYRRERDRERDRDRSWSRDREHERERTREHRHREREDRHRSRRFAFVFFLPQIKFHQNIFSDIFFLSGLISFNYSIFAGNTGMKKNPVNITVQSTRKPKNPNVKRKKMVMKHLVLVGALQPQRKLHRRGIKKKKVVISHFILIFHLTLY